MRCPARPLQRLQGVSCIWLVVCACTTLLSAQGTKQDYERALGQEERTRGKVFRSRVRPYWLEGAARFWYRIDTGPQQYEFVLVDAEHGTRRAAFDHSRLAAALAEKTGSQVDPARLPLRGLSLAGDRSALTFTALGNRWKYDPASDELTEVTEEDPAGGNDHGVLNLDVLHPSPGTGEETVVRFQNRTAGELTLYWYDFDGERRHYATIAPGGQHEQHTYEGHVWLLTDAEDRPVAAVEATAEHGESIIDGSRRPKLPAEGPAARRRSARAESPDGRWRVVIRDHNVQLLSTPGDESFALSSDGTADDPYVARFWWSPDSGKFVVLQQRRGEDRQITLVESAPADQLQPKLHTLAYAKPGDRMPVPRPRLFDVAARSQLPSSDALFSNAWSISQVRWAADSGSFTFLYNQRGHQVLRILEVDAATAEARAVIDEQSSTFIDYAHKQFSHYLDDSQEIIWMSERDGWNHLYLYDARTGQVKNQITRGPWVCRGVEHVDEGRREIWIRAGGVYAAQDPYHVHLCRVNFDGSGFTVLTSGDGTHQWSFSPDRRHFIDTWSRVDQPPVSQLRRSADGSLVCELERADWSALLETGWRPPERLVARGRDGQTDIYGILVRPSNFDPQGKYPVIEKIYAGPQSAHVPKSFGRLSEIYALAELGFIVAQIDGMGTSHRSKAFHDVCWKNLGDAGFPDRIRWLQAAAELHAELDLTRVGIYGGSAGGQNALGGLLAHGDFYKVAVADCGCHDNRMDKIWWNELWMGWPLGPHYAEQSNVTQAHRLEGKLLLTVGELDRNVDPASTMQVADALVKADKDFDLLIVPGAGHGAGESPYGRRRRMDFFVRHLLGVEPRWEP